MTHAVKLPGGGLPDGGINLYSLNEKREQLIMKCAELEAQIISETESINEYKGHPERFQIDDNDKLSGYENRLNSLLSKIKERARACLNSLSCDTSLGELKLPPRQGFPRQTVRTDSPILLKYREIRGESILGKPISHGEQQCVDGDGKYIMYEKGVIISHPQFGTREVHGRIFESYKRQDMERGPLGYPKSDVERLPTGLHISKFQHT